jgi:hypothetical protein
VFLCVFGFFQRTAAPLPPPPAPPAVMKAPEPSTESSTIVLLTVRRLLSVFLSLVASPELLVPTEPRGSGCGRPRTRSRDIRRVHQVRPRQALRRSRGAEGCGHLIGWSIRFNSLAVVFLQVASGLCAPEDAVRVFVEFTTLAAAQTGVSCPFSF